MASTWLLRAVGDGSGMVADAANVRAALQLFADPDAACELMALTSGIQRTLPGDDLEGMARAVNDLPSGIGVYFRINPVPRGLNRPAKDTDVLKRRWLYVDVDPVKPDEFKDWSATATEKDAAGSVCDAVNEYMQSLGWPAPVIVDSGNGYAMFWRCDLPNDAIVKATYKRWLESLAVKFSGERGKIDKSIHNASRLVKLPGTWARKGRQSGERPHRACRVIATPARLEVVTFEQLKAVAPEKGQQIVAPSPARDPFKARVGESGDNRPYVLAALDGEKSKLALTPAGDRDNQLYRSGAALGELVGPGLLTESEVVESLSEAADICGLSSDISNSQVRDKIARSVAKGKSNPRQIPESRNGEPVAKWSVPVEPSKTGPTIYTIPELMSLDLPEARWAIPGLLSEGLTLLAGKPKLGKSWMALNLALTIAAGGKALGAIQVQPGDVLYLALEDRLRRIRDRAGKVLSGLKAPPSHRLSVAVEWKRQHQGGVKDLADWLERATDPRLVVIDVWAKFRTPAKSKGSAYEQDYEQLTEVKSMADYYGASVLCLHHTRKSAADDVFDEISGTLGIAGAADGSMVLARARGKNEGTLAMTGRDIEEQTLSVEFDPNTFTWKSHGSAEERLTGELQMKVLNYLKLLNGGSTFTNDIAEHVKEDVNKVRTTLHRLFDKRIIQHVGSSWSYPGDGAEEEAD